MGMTENLGAILTKHKEDREAAVKRQAEAEERKQQAEYKAAVKEADDYLEKLRTRIPGDVKNQYRAGADYPDRLTYVLSNLLVKDRGWESPMDQQYYLGSLEIWARFVKWAKEHGLHAAIWEKSHSEYNKDDGYSVHDYYYIILRPLKD